MASSRDAILLLLRHLQRVVPKAIVKRPQARIDGIQHADGATRAATPLRRPAQTPGRVAEEAQDDASGAGAEPGRVFAVHDGAPDRAQPAGFVAGRFFVGVQPAAEVEEDGDELEEGGAHGAGVVRVRGGGDEGAVEARGEVGGEGGRPVGLVGGGATTLGVLG
jgi:hypothetical protein